jgi:preprotein translocase subunit SecF
MTMFVTLTVLAGLISTMFVASVVSTISELRREREDLEDFARRHSAF